MSENQLKSQINPHLAIKYPALILSKSLVIMVIFDQIIWEKQLGMQFLLITLLMLLGLWIMSTVEKKHVPWQSYLLLIPTLFGAAMTIIHKEASTTLFNVFLTMSGLMLLALTLLNGQWLLYRIREVLTGLTRLIQSALIDPVRLLIEKKISQSELPADQHQTTWKAVWPYLRGVLIAIPLLLALGGLLASADLIFRERISNLFDYLRIENFGEVIWRATYILILAYLLSGAYIYALALSKEKKALRPDSPYFSQFLGTAEAFTVMALVNLLFLAFIIVQFRYFFAGEANISLEGFTYAEYARRGFFELVAVALISLGLYYLLSMFTKRSDPKNKGIFSALGLLLMLQVGILLLSAFQRLSLYEAAYGFTTLRTLTHIFMIWLGVLIASVTLMEIFNQFKRLAVVLFLVIFGFTLTLNLLNVDSFIAQRNIEHAIAGNPLDAHYLVWNLSDDGIPALFEFSQAQETPGEVKEDLHAILACHYAVRKDYEVTRSWPEWHLAASRADALFERNQASLASYPFIKQVETYTYEEEGEEIEDVYEIYFIEVNGEEVFCKSTVR